MAAMVPAHARVSGYFGPPAVDHVRPAQESPLPAGAFFRAGAALPALRTDLAVRAAGAGPVSAPASHASLSGGNLAVALRAEASPLSAFRRCPAGVGAGFQELQAGGRRGDCHGRKLRHHICHRPVGVEPVLADGARVWNPTGFCSLPELSAARLAQPKRDLAAIPACCLGLRLGAELLLRSEEHTSELQSLR